MPKLPLIDTGPLPRSIASELPLNVKFPVTLNAPELLLIVPAVTVKPVQFIVPLLEMPLVPEIFMTPAVSVTPLLTVICGPVEIPDIAIFPHETFAATVQSPFPLPVTKLATSVPVGCVVLLPPPEARDHFVSSEKLADAPEIQYLFVPPAIFSTPHNVKLGYSLTVRFVFAASR